MLPRTAVERPADNAPLGDSGVITYERWNNIKGEAVNDSAQCRGGCSAGAQESSNAGRRRAGLCGTHEWISAELRHLKILELQRYIRRGIVRNHERLRL